MTNKKEQLEEFYNYKHWRDIQRNQLNTSSNIIFTFSATIIGFTVNYLMKNKICSCETINSLLRLSVIALLFSILFYLVMNISKLIDFRKTARSIKRAIKNEITFEDIGKKTKLLGDISWWSFWLELAFALIGFIFLIISIFKTIY
ncbi:hypothetical protein [Flavobacterium sp. 14A]|uniref:hypothetical protein n=1 Tax=Flavobacterium sp. 14A TaxID=2735896 RepID=UPI00156F1EC8|nr:hypothetical protein [Flavobacterium sp. 14A]NRT10545.1 hypothetical protein [Flavobacterium sp. 14A]